MELGYACINTELGEQGIRSGRTFSLKTFNEKGLDYIEGLIIRNIEDLAKTVIWNKNHNISLFRITNEIFSHTDLYKLKDLKNWTQMSEYLKIVGGFANEWGHRLSFHAEPYSVLASQNPIVAEKAISDLDVLAGT